jgi:membrane protease YdiL (CAAX protease family)
MPQVELLKTWTGILAALLLYGAVALAAGSMLFRLLPRQRQRCVSWTGLEVILAAFMVFVLWPGFASLLLTKTILGDWLYGVDMMSEVRKLGENLDPALRHRLNLVASLIAFPFQVLSVLLFLHRLGGTRPYQLGLTTNQVGRNVLLGVLGWLILTPVVLGLNMEVTELLQVWEPKVVKEHPFLKLRESGMLTGLEMSLLVFQAVIAAPVIEELFFRGVLLRWLTRNRWASPVVIGLSVCLAIPVEREKWEQLRRMELMPLLPALFVLISTGGYLWIRSREKDATPSAIYASSLLFGMIHQFAWPSPVPLFFLALGLGWLAQRTQSLVGPMVLHGLFNGVACVQLLLME